MTRLIGIGSGYAQPLKLNYKWILDNVSASGLNCVRFYLLQLKESLTESHLSTIYDFCNYARSKGIIVVVSISDKRVSSSSSDWPRQEEIITRLYNRLTSLGNIIWETGNELTQGYEYEMRIVNKLRSLGAKEIMSSALTDAEKVKPYVDYFSYHTICGTGAINKELGSKSVYDTDGCGLEAVPASNLYAMAKKAFERNSHFFFDQGLKSDGSFSDPERVAALKRASDDVPTNGPLPYPCPYCPATFLSQAELDAHIAAEHPVIEAIDVGQYCTELSKQTGLGAETIISRGNPANASGILTQVTFWLKEAASVKIGVFYIISGNTLKCRSVHNAGARPVGKSVVSVSLAIQSGDYIGVGKDAGGRFAYHYAYDGGMWKYKANTCIVNNQTTYELDPDGRISVCGIGVTPEVITTQEIVHSCTARISYDVSSYPGNNDALGCPHCGLSLGVVGIKGSQEIIEVPEVITPHIVICSKCTSKLELSISSFANKNIQQYCPVCGQAAD